MRNLILATAALLLTSTPAFASDAKQDQSFSVFGALLHRPVIFVKSISTGAQHGAIAGLQACGADETTTVKEVSLPVLGVACLGAAAGAVVEPVVNTFTGKDPDQE